MTSRIINPAPALALMMALALPMAADAKAPAATKDLRIVAVDVEGGSATLFVTPEGKSLLIDTGWAPGAGDPRPIAGAPPLTARTSAEKIAAAAAALGVTRIDYLIITHYHGDHVGGLKTLMEKLPVGTFIDHGQTAEPGTPDRPGLYPPFLEAIAGHPQIVPHAGQTLDIGSLHLTFVSVDGHVLDAALPGAGQPNPACAGVPQMARDGGAENARSVSTLITFGKTRITQFGDLSWNKEIELLCPTNKVGPIDVYFVTQHGMDLSSSPPTAAMDPVVSIMANGPLKGGDEAPLKMIGSYPHGKELWTLHYSVRYPDLNGDANLIANPDWIPDQYYTISVRVTPQGVITVTNDRNNYRKTYKARLAA